MADRYANFQALAQAEQEGLDFRVVVSRRDARFVIIAPHGGNIEPGSSEIAKALAGQDLALYTFEGIKYYGNGALHITSANFDEPRCIALVQTVQTAITVHGESGDTRHVYLGGLDTDLKAHLKAALQAADFSVAVHHNPRMQGVHPANICNRAQSGRGVQIEIARGLRETFFASMSEDGRQSPTPRCGEFVRAVRDALANAPTQAHAAPAASGMP